MAFNTHDIIFGQACYEWYSIKMGAGRTSDPSYDVQIEIDKRPNAINRERREVRELKPDNPRAIREGKKRLEQYVRDLEQQTGEKWTGYLDTYKQ